MNVEAIFKLLRIDLPAMPALLGDMTLFLFGDLLDCSVLIAAGTAVHAHP